MFEDILTTNPLEIDNYEEKINQNKDKSNLNEAVITGQGKEFVLQLWIVIL